MADSLLLRNGEPTLKGVAQTIPEGDSKDEAKLCAREPIDCWRARNTADDAKVWALKLYGTGHSVNTEKDAFRHCMWSALMTVRANADFAERMGYAHEDNEGSRAGRMDIHNNSWGRTAGLGGGDETDRKKADRCLAYAWYSNLIWFGHGI